MKRTNIIHAILALTSFALLSGCGTPSGDSALGSGSDTYAGVPNVSKLSNGNYFVSLGGGKTASYRSDGSLIAQSGMSYSEQATARRAVDSHIREQGAGDSHGSTSGAPEVRPRQDGKIEVLMPGGCVILYNKFGTMIQKGRSCSSDDVSRANRAVQAYLREQNS